MYASVLEVGSAHLATVPVQFHEAVKACKTGGCMRICLAQFLQLNPPDEYGSHIQLLSLASSLFWEVFRLDFWKPMVTHTKSSHAVDH